MQSTLMQWKRHFKCNDKHFNALLWMLMQCNTEPAHWWEQPSLPGLFLLSTKLQVTALYCTCVVCSQCTWYRLQMHIDASHWYNAHWCNTSHWCTLQCRCNVSHWCITLVQCTLMQCIKLMQCTLIQCTLMHQTDAEMQCRLIQCTVHTDADCTLMQCIKLM